VQLGAGVLEQAVRGAASASVTEVRLVDDLDGR
jgi:hypothetical protein